jgi:hypothetical protein
LYELPDVIDPNIGAKVRVKVSQLPYFCSFSKRTFFVNPTRLSQIGAYTISITLTDDSKTPL